MARIVSYFSCGIPSAIATKLAYEAEWPEGYDEFSCYNFEIKEEHEDNRRFLADVQKWFGSGIPIKVTGNDEYNRSVDEVVRKTRFLVGPSGARCTAELKKAVRHEVGRPDDLIVLGYTSEEQHRVDRLLKSEPWLKFWPILIDRKLSREDCMALWDQTGIKRPLMYDLGYANANCIGCVKGQAGYWNKIKIDFPERFAEMAAIERELGRTICKREWVDANGKRQLERIYLDELPPDLGRYDPQNHADCGFFCVMAKTDFMTLSEGAA
jgi:hypothetical protein